MSKEEEIKHLSALMGDTYFNQYFSTADIKQMIENIKNDFCIESGCDFATIAQRLEKRLEEEKKASKAKMIDFAESILIGAEEMEDVSKTITGYIGIENVIKIKHKNKLELSEEEITYLVSKL